MQIIEKKLSELKPYENNPRKNDEAVKYVANSIKEFGFKVPVVIDKDGTIICGHTRYKAAKRLKLPTVPCVVADDLSEEQIRAYRLADNKVSELAEWDIPLLTAELQEIFSFNMADFGFDHDDTLDKVKEDEPPREAEQRTNPGELWQLGDHKLMVGDSTDPETFRLLMGEEKAEMVFTDPPYNVNYGITDPIKAKKSRKRTDGLIIANDKQTDEQFYDFLVKAFTNMFNYTGAGGAFYICYASREGRNFINALDLCGISVRQELIWAKNIFVIGRQDYHWQHEPILYGNKPGASHRFYGGRRLGTLLQEDWPVEIGLDTDGGNIIVVHIGKKRVVLKAPSVEVLNIDDDSTLLFVDRPTRSIEHPTMKPILLVAKCVRNSSKKGQIVLDPFGGSGSTLLACEQTGRKCRTIELDPKYADVIIERWEKLTGREAVKIE